MRDLLRNQQPVFFKLYEGAEEITDQFGNSTGQYLPKYSDLKSVVLCVSPNKGTSETEQFGTITDYDRTMTTSNPNCPIDEGSVLWIDGVDTDGPWNYVVKAVSPWKNSMQYAIQEVNISTYEAVQKQINDGNSLIEKYKKEATATDNAEDNTTA